MMVVGETPKEAASCGFDPRRFLGRTLGYQGMKLRVELKPIFVLHAFKVAIHGVLSSPYESVFGSIKIKALEWR
jgi:hypothetical protein